MKPREYYLHASRTSNALEVEDGYIDQIFISSENIWETITGTTIHVIEKSAYDKLVTALEEINAILKRREDDREALKTIYELELSMARVKAKNQLDTQANAHLYESED